MPAKHHHRKEPHSSFVSRFMDRKGGSIRFIKSTENGRAFWCYLHVDPHKWQDYECALRQSVMNIRDYGVMLKSGWGEYPPPGIIAHMRETFGVETPPGNQERPSS